MDGSLDTTPVTEPTDFEPEDPGVPPSPEPHAVRFERAPPRLVPKSLLDRFAEVNKELWLILSMLVIAALLNYLAAGHRMVLGFYTFPTLFSAYYYGRRHATLTAVASIAVVVLLGQVNPHLANVAGQTTSMAPWTDLIAWGAMLMVAGYTMGTLYERNKTRLGELRSTYRGLLLILRQFIGRDRQTENHCYRVSVYAARIGERFRLPADRLEDVQAAALLHDIGKLGVSRQILEKAASFSNEEYEHVKSHVRRAGEILEPVSGPLNRILPIILAHHERHDGSGYGGAKGEEIPLEARIIAVADVYDALTSDRPYRRAMSPYEAREIITNGSGKDFDPAVVRAFQDAFQHGELEAPRIVL